MRSYYQPYAGRDSFAGLSLFVASCYNVNMARKVKIGKVAVKYYNSHSDKVSYEDAAEDYLLNFFTSPQSQKQSEITRELNSNPSWPIRYHLSPQREFLLDWYEFKKEGVLLELGAGCGALTGLFCGRVKKVYSNELESKRGEIIANRFSDKENLEVLIGNLEELKVTEKVDYVVVIGVLEYAGKFISSKGDNIDEPYINFLKKTSKYLKPGGRLLLAIENKIGLKYIVGGKEDHYGELFPSLENYPNYQGIKTFTKNELSDLFTVAGFKDLTFYFPYPDYKLPFSMFSELGLSTKLNIAKSSFSQVVDRSHERIPLFNEILFASSLDKEEILTKFANSFLVEATL